MISRRALLLGAGASWASPLAARPPGPEIPPSPPPPARPDSLLDRMLVQIPPRLDMVCPHTGESWTGWFYQPSTARYDAGALDSLEWFLRDHRREIRVPICVRLYWALAAAAHDARLRGHHRPIELLSGYRTPATNAALRGSARDSMHMYGRAADIRIPGVPAAELAALMRLLQVGGVGRYDRGRFVHIDSGKIRNWTG